MARKRKRKKNKKNSSTLSDGVRQSIIGIIFVAVGVIFLLSFFNLAGLLGEYVDNVLSAVFGWDRWLVTVVLFLLSWNVIFPDRRLLSVVNWIGIIIFFVTFNGFLNLVLVKDAVANPDAIFSAGGYVGLLFSNPLVQLLGFWGTLVVSLSGVLVSVLLIFNISFSSLSVVHEHFGKIGGLFHRKANQRKRDLSDDEEYDDDDEEDYDEEYDEEYDEDEEDIFEDDEFDDEEELEENVKEKKSKTDLEDVASESVMTSRRRRRIKIPVDLLDDKSTEAKSGDVDKNAEIIENTFANFGIDIEVLDVKVGPSVTQYALKPAEGIKLSRIVALQNDLALALAAHPIRVEAPIPGKSLVGIEVPNQSVGMVSLRELLESKEFKRRKTQFSAPLGKDVGGSVISIGIDKAPHMLVAGATGSGKSVCLNVIIAALLYQNGPDDLKFIMVDPKRVELGVYTGIPHLLIPPITKAEEAINALKWAVREMERRLDHLAKFGVRDIDSYNEKSKERMPKIVIIIDELADLMSQSKREVEAVIVRIAQMARAAGIHLVLATQRPSVDVITGTIKANIPTRLAFAVASQVDSKTILDISGAEKLLGRGDMLMSTPALSKPKRIQGAYVSDSEIERVVGFLKKEGEPDYNYQVTEDTRTGGTSINSSDSDPLMEDAIKIILESKKASTSYLQRRMKIGYSRAARIIDMLEEMGIIGEQNGSKPRSVLIDQWPPESNNKEDKNEDEEEDNQEFDKNDELDYQDEEGDYDESDKEDET